MREFSAALGTPAASRAEFAFCKITNVALAVWTREALATPESEIDPLERLVAILLIPFPALVKTELNGAGAAPTTLVIADKIPGMALDKLLIAALQLGSASCSGGVVSVGVGTAGVVTVGLVAEGTSGLVAEDTEGLVAEDTAGLVAEDTEGLVADTAGL
ncbi:hypothetical protein BGZ97_007826, partial [Linnemannia gamsii]